MKAFAALTLALATSVVSAQRPASAPETAPSGKPPDTVMMEDLTWAEVRDLVKAGWTNVIVGTAGTEQKGPHMVDGEHKFVMAYAADKIARGLGRTLVAPIVTYVPEGSWDTVGGHMGKPGTITLPEDRFVDLLVSAGRSLKAGGFTNVLFVGESGGNRTGMRSAAEKLNALWQGSGAKAYWVDDYYTKAHREQETFAAKFLGVPEAQVGNHANILDTSELLFVAPQHIRRDRLVGNDYDNNGVSGINQSKSSPEVGRQLLQIKIDNALAQSKRMMTGAEPPVPAAPQQGGGGGGRPGAAARASGAAAGPPRPTMETAPAGKTPTRAPDTVFIDELTWEETRDALKAGTRRAIIPTGGTEKNGYHMVLGKHNFVVAHAANLMARRLGQTLVAPVIQYVPEGDPDRQTAGAISAALAGLRSIARRCGTQSEGPRLQRAPVHRRQRREPGGHARRGRGAEHGMEGRRRESVCAHRLLRGRPRTLPGVDAGGVRLRRCRSSAVMPASATRRRCCTSTRPASARIRSRRGADRRIPGVTGDPVKATAEIGRMGIEFKVNAGIGQYQLLKNPPPSRQRPSGQ